MQLPAALRDALEQLAESIPLAQLRAAAKNLSDRYREGQGSATALRDHPEHIAYALARMPATYTAAVHALQQLQARCPAFAPRTLLDLGAGPGTAAWAACEVFP